MQFFPRVDDRIMPLALVIITAVVNLAVFQPGCFPAGLKFGKGLRFNPDDGPYHHDFMVFAQVESKQVFVFGIKAPGQAEDAAVRQFFCGEIQGDLVGLAGVTQVCLVDRFQVSLRYSVGRQGLRGPLSQGFQVLQQVFRAGFFRHGDISARRLVLDLRGCIPVGAQDTGTRRDNDRPGARQDAQGIGMQRTGAAETDQGEIPGVVALLHGDQAQRAEHGFIHDFYDPFCGFHQADTHGVGQLLYRSLRRRFFYRHGAAQLHVRGQVSQHHVGIAYRGFLAPFHVGRRTGNGSGGLRTDTQGPGQFRDKGDGASAGAHSAHIDRRRPDAHVADDGLPPHPGLAVLDQGHVCRRAAHVESQDVVVTRPAAKIQGAGHPSGRSRHEHVNRRLRRCTTRCQPAI